MMIYQINSQSNNRRYQTIIAPKLAIVISKIIIGNLSLIRMLAF